MRFHQGLVRMIKNYCSYYNHSYSSHHSCEAFNLVIPKMELLVRRLVSNPQTEKDNKRDCSIRYRVYPVSSGDYTSTDISSYKLGNTNTYKCNNRNPCNPLACHYSFV